MDTVSNTNKLSNITNLVDYLTEFAPVLAQKITDNNTPLFNPGDSWNPKLFQAKRAPFQGQGDVIMSMVETLKKQDSAFIVGEMGTGKSLIGAMIPWVCMDSPRVLIMCPPHLVVKWCREIEETVPNAKASIITGLKDAIKIESQAAAHEGPRYWILSREKGKLRYATKPAGKTQAAERRYHEKNKETDEFEERIEEIEQVICPRCGQIVMESKKDKDGIETLSELPADTWRKRKSYCQCGEALWCAIPKPRRFAIADYVKKHLPKNFFDFFVCDEVHEMKAPDTAQGNAFGTLASCAKKILSLTGTLLGGYASHLFYLNYRTNPRKMVAQGFKYRKTKSWVQKYGVEERIVKESQSVSADNKNSKGRKHSSETHEKPGISPALFADQLMDSAVFLHLDDVACDLPEFTESVVGVDMTPEMQTAYDELEGAISEVMCKQLAQGNKSLLGSYLVNLLSYPDKPFDNESVFLSPSERHYKPWDLGTADIYPKEKKLLDLVTSELNAGRKCLVFAQYTGIRDVTVRMKKILTDKGIKAEILRAGVNPQEREQWVKDHVAAGMDVMICNPALVQTGLDLLDFPTIVYMQTGYNIFTLQQSSRRSFRIGQDKPVNVFYFYYNKTMQARAVALIGKKLNASLAIQGRLVDSGLVSLVGTEEDSALALAKSLQNGGVEGIETTWKQLKAAKAFKAVKPVKTPQMITTTTDGETSREVSAAELWDEIEKSDAGTWPGWNATPDTEYSDEINIEEAISARVDGHVDGPVETSPEPLRDTGIALENLLTAFDNKLVSALSDLEIPAVDAQPISRKKLVKKFQEKVAKAKKARKAAVDNSWRMDAENQPGLEYKWTKNGWRKISQKEIDGKIKREETARMNAWKYDGAVNPADSKPDQAYYWVNGYSYARILKSGESRTINVRGHWRIKHQRAEIALRKAA
jgi:superfamily II DNA or RNA helicase